MGAVGGQLRVCLPPAVGEGGGARGSEEGLAGHSEHSGICSMHDGQPREAPEQGIGVKNCACFRVSVPEMVIAVLNSPAPG